MARPKKEKVRVKKKIYRTPWAELMNHVFKYDVDLCDHCGTKLVLIACIQSRAVCQKIFEHLKIPIEEITATAPRAPLELDFFAQNSMYVENKSDSSELNFDQRGEYF